MRLEEVIKAKIAKALDIDELVVENQSHLHVGHAGDDGSGETHYKLKVVSLEFDGMSRLERQRVIYRILEEELKTQIHALEMKLEAHKNSK